MSTQLLRRTLIAILLVALASAACGTDDNGDEPSGDPLPTLASLGGAAGADTSPTSSAADGESETPTDPPAAQESPTSADTESGPTLTPTIPPTPTLPEIATAEPSHTPTLRPVPATQPAPTADVPLGVDLADADVGDALVLEGEISIDGDSVFLTTGDGAARVELADFSALGATLVDKIVQVSGVVQSVPANDQSFLIVSVNGVFERREESLAPDISALTDPNTILTPPAAQSQQIVGTLLPPDAETLQDGSLSALQTFDQLIAALGDEATAYEWVSLRGSPTRGWTFAFYVPDELVIRSYQVGPTNVTVGQGGLIQLAPDLPAVAVNEETFVGLDRSAIDIDSDDLDSVATGLDVASVSLGLEYALTVDDSLQMIWTISDLLGERLLTIDAGTGDEIGVD